MIDQNLAVGVDNIFILLSAWRATDIDLAPMKRISSAFGDAYGKGIINIM
jgi:hypothetical protein